MMLALAIWAPDMSASSNLRAERLAQNVPRFNAAYDLGGAISLNADSARKMFRFSST